MLAALLVIAAVGVTFAACLPNEFLDTPVEHIHLSGARGLALLEHAVARGRPAALHASGIALHAACAVFVLLVGRRLALHAGIRRGPATLGGASAALLFALHPLRTEPVADPGYHATPLATLLALGSLLAYLRADGGTRRAPWLVASLVVYALSLATSPLGVALPAVLVALDGWPLRRWRAGAGAWIEKLPFVLLSAGAAYVSVRWGSNPFDRPLALLATAGFAPAFYMWKIAWPTHLIAMYDLPPALEKHVWRYVLSGLGWLGGTALILAYVRRVPALAVTAAAYATLALGGVIFLHTGHEEAADRFAYLPAVPWAVLAGGGIAWLADRSNRLLRVAAVAGTCAVLAVAGVLGVRASQQCRIWRTRATLWTHAFAHPHLAQPSARATYEVARAADDADLLERALQLYRSLAGRGDYPDVHVRIARVLLRDNRALEAVDACENGLRAAPADAELHIAAAAALAAINDLARAESHLRRAIEIDESSVEARRSLGRLLLMQGRWMEAQGTLFHAIELAPGDADLRFSMARALDALGILRAAAEYYREALALDPEHDLARAALERLESGATYGPAERP